jgi:UDP-glucuronate 4-epimerase
VPCHRVGVERCDAKGLCVNNTRSQSGEQKYSEEIFNLGCGRQEELMEYVRMVEVACGKEAKKNFLPMQPGDVKATSADISHAQEKLGFRPQTMIKDGVPRFVEWYREYYGL